VDGALDISAIFRPGGNEWTTVALPKTKSLMVVDFEIMVIILKTTQYKTDEKKHSRKQKML
jgi:hypothetical protein